MDYRILVLRHLLIGCILFMCASCSCVKLSEDEFLGTWKAEDGSRVKFNGDGTIELFDFVAIKDTMVYLLPQDQIDSLRSIGQSLTGLSTYKERKGVITYAKQLWTLYNHTFDSYISIGTNASCVFEGPFFYIPSPFYAYRNYRPPFEIKYLYHYYGDPDACREHRFYRELEDF